MAVGNKAVAAVVMVVTILSSAAAVHLAPPTPTAVIRKLLQQEEDDCLPPMIIGSCCTGCGLFPFHGPVGRCCDPDNNVCTLVPGDGSDFEACVPRDMCAGITC
ncbi:hypothetical protein Zm00014a_022685 [Zea mays]|jgi:hypothetical protein|uniref:Uncharacterized protein n=2 Tax=Zea mays TaxID=4577 RepID=A0A3L6G4C3_MAIZE|nr:hypothetical protein ZEAMMB73_Zm00001d007955 [Zea mays]PWZ41651.1 hypothetical protein Zm00014a_022685 [Zea mays]